MRDIPVIPTQGDPKSKRRRNSADKNISILKRHEAGAPVPGIARRHGIAANTSCAKFREYCLDRYWFARLTDAQLASTTDDRI